MRISQTEIETEISATFSSVHFQGSGCHDRCVMALTSLCLFLLVSRAEGSSICQPLQLPVQLQNCPVLSRCLLHTGAGAGMSFCQGTRTNWSLPSYISQSRGRGIKLMHECTEIHTSQRDENDVLTRNRKGTDLNGLVVGKVPLKREHSG